MKKIQFSSFGFSSILLMFVMICIVTFSTLTVVTANSDYKLSKKVATKTTNYSLAERDIYQRVATLDNQCQQAYQTTTNEEAYYSLLECGEDHLITYTCEINENQYLEAKILISYPQNIGSSYLSIQSWMLVNKPVEIEDSGWNLLGE